MKISPKLPRASLDYRKMFPAVTVGLILLGSSVFAQQTINYADGTSNNNSIDTTGSNATLNSIGAGDASEDDAISGTGTATKTGVGRVLLSAANTYAGGTTVKEGTLEVTGSILHAGGSVVVGSSNGDQGLLEIPGTVTNSAGLIGLSAGSNGTATMNSGNWTNNNSLAVGSGGTGTLNITSGTVSSASANIASSAGSTGTASVNGGSWINASSLLVGVDGDGTLTISDTGAVSALQVVLGFGSTGEGDLNLNGGTLTTGQVFEGAGAGTVDFNGGTLQLSGDQASLFSGFEAGNVTLGAGVGTIDTQGFDVATSQGLAGTGGLVKAGTGSLTLSGANTYEGVTGLKEGTLAVTGSIDHAFYPIAVGYESGGDGLLEISGTVTNSDGEIGLSAGSTGRAIVSSGSWTNNSSLAVGSGGAGTLSITGGTVSSAAGNIALSAGSTGTASVSGGSWTNNNGLSVGVDGDGTLNISDTGAVSALEVVLGFGSTGEGDLNLNGGTLTTGQVSKGDGAGTVDFDRGTLQLSGDQASLFDNFEAGNVTLNFGGTIDTQGFDVATSQGLVGFGTLTKTGTGTLTLSGENTYRGGTVLREGTLAITGSIYDAAYLIGVGSESGDDATLEISGTASSFNGLIGHAVDSTGMVRVNAGSWTNTGSLLVGRRGNGTLEISDTGTVSASYVSLGVFSDSVGALHLNGGTLTTGQVSKGDGAGTVDFDGGTLQLSGDQASLFSGFEAGNVTLGAGNGTIDTQAFDVATDVGLDGAGAGGLTKSGNGSLTLSAANTYEGATAVNAGSLYVEGSLSTGNVTVADLATLGGSGIINGEVTVQDGGTLAPGSSPGILTVANLVLEEGSTTAMEINGPGVGTQYDQIVVNDTATLNGGTLQLTFAEEEPVNGRSYTLISADQDIEGDFDLIELVFGQEIVYGIDITNEYIFNIIGIETDFASMVGLDPELMRIASVLDDNFADLGLVPIINALNLLPDEDVALAFQQINPQELTVLQGLTLANARTLGNRLKNRQRAVRGGATGFSSADFHLYDETGQQIRNSLLADSSQAMPAGGQTQALSFDRGLSSYISGSGTTSDYDGDRAGPGYEADSFSIVMGADYRLDDDLAVGAYLGYNNANADLGEDGGSADTDSFRLGLTGTYWNPLTDTTSYYTTAHLGLAHHEYDTKRNAFGSVASGDTDAFEFDLGTAIGYEVNFGDLLFTTDLSLDYINLAMGGYTESGSLAPLAIEDDRSESLYSTLSFRLDYNGEYKGIALLPYAHAGWRHEYLDDSSSVSARFASSPGGGFSVEGAQVARDSLVGGFGLGAVLQEGLIVQLGYYGELSSEFESHSLLGSVEIKF